MSDDNHERSDADLLASVRAGDDQAYAELWNRHRPVATRLARSLTSRDHEDLVSEAFSRILVVLRNGGGPEVAFRPYLMTSIRRLAIDRAKSAQQREVLTGEEADLDLPLEESLEDGHTEGVDAAIAWSAWRSLPEQTRALLWHAVIEEERPSDIARTLGVSANSVASRTKRARERLRQAYLSEHAAHTEDEECRRVRARLGSYVRHAVGPRGSRQIRDHLHHCRECRAAYAEIRQVDQMVLGVIAGIITGGAALLAISRIVAPTTAAAATVNGAGVGAGVGAGIGGSPQGLVARGVRLVGSSTGRVLVGVGAVSVVAAVTTTALAGQPAPTPVSAPAPISTPSSTSAPSSAPSTPASDRPATQAPTPAASPRTSGPTLTLRLESASPTPSTTTSSTTRSSTTAPARASSSPTSSATSSPTATSSPSPEPSATNSSAEPSPSAPTAVEPTPEPSQTPDPSQTPEPSQTPPPTPSTTPEPTPTVSATPTPTSEPSPTSAPSATSTEPTPTPTETTPPATETMCRFTPDTDIPYRARLRVPDGFRIVSVVDQHDGRDYEHVRQATRSFDHLLMPTSVRITVIRVGSGEGSLQATFTSLSGQQLGGDGTCSLE